jgi:hypothetical protein
MKMQNATYHELSVLQCVVGVVAGLVPCTHAGGLSGRRELEDGGGGRRRRGRRRALATPPPGAVHWRWQFDGT